MAERGTLTSINDLNAEAGRAFRRFRDIPRAVISEGDALFLRHGGESFTIRITGIDAAGDGRFTLHAEPLTDEEAG